jgi:hypothetical protein
MVADNGGNIVSFDLLKGTLFHEDGWIVWDGKASEDGQTASIVHRKMRLEALRQQLAASLAGTPYATYQNLFMSYISDDLHVYVVDVQQKTFKMPDGTVWSAQTALGNIAVSAVKVISSSGVIDSPN